jgi:hypothetical protein
MKTWIRVVGGSAIILVILAFIGTACYIIFKALPTETPRAEKTVPTVETPKADKVLLPVISRININVSSSKGTETKMGFIVEDGEDLRVLCYEKGSVADDPAFQPTNISVTKSPDGKITWNPIRVDVEIK